MMSPQPSLTALDIVLGGQGLPEEVQAKKSASEIDPEA